MPILAKTTIAGQLHAARLALTNTAADPEIQACVAAFGYTAARLAKGERLFENASAAITNHVLAAGAQRQATANARAAHKAARASYQALAQTARAVFGREPGSLRMLGLVGGAPETIPAFLAAAYMLFDNAATLGERDGTLASYGYDAARLAEQRAAVAAYDQSYRAQVAAMGAARRSTHEQRVALVALNRWVAQYLKIARVALQDRPELIEKIGGVSRGARTPAQREAPRKAAATRAGRQDIERSPL